MTIEHTRARLGVAGAQSRREHYARRRALVAPVFATTPTDAVGQELSAAEEALDRAEAELAAATAALDDALGAAAPLWAAGSAAVPIALFPLRLEARFRATGATAELLLRAYPDEIHVDAFDPRLSPSELELAGTYWGDVTSNPDHRVAAWQKLLSRLAPTRAAWAVERLRPSDGRSSVANRGPSDTQVATSPLLPERLIFSGYRHAALAWRVEGRVIPLNLALSPDLATLGTAANDPTGENLPWTELSRWLIDFDEAERLGMAVRVSLPEGPLIFDLVTAVGVAAADPATGASRLSDALQAQYYTKGLGFLAPGTPTNNTPASRSGWSSRPAPLPPEEVDTRRASFDLTGPSDAARLARAFGIDGRAALALLDGQSPDEGDNLPTAIALVAEFIQLLASGCFPDPLANLDVGSEWVQAGQPLAEHFRDHVRARGPLPTIRVGRQPYGLLPATSLTLWKGSDAPDLVVKGLRTLIPYAVAEPVGARIADAPDQDNAFVDVLTRVPRSSRAWASSGAGGAGQTAGLSLFGWLPDDSPARPASAGPPDETGGMRVADQIPEPLRDLLTANGFAPLTSLVELAVQAGEATPPGADPDLIPFFTAFDEDFGHLDNPLEIIEYIGPGTGFYVALSIQFAFWLMPTAALVVVARNRATAAGNTALAARIGAVLDLLRGLASTIATLGPAAAQDLARLDGLVAEAIDAAWHRIDAWMTSLATARLKAHRAATPDGIGIGAYGWLEDLRARSPGERDAGDGWVLAPSQHHAVTAAVLRSGWLAHEDQAAFAVDLSSARVRRARSMLEGVAAGETISRLLGYQFERALHEGQLDFLIKDYRHHFPLTTGGNAADAVADGEAVRQARPLIMAAGTDVQDLLPPAGDDIGRAALFAILADLDDAIDAVGDLLLAEGVHQLVGGSAERAATSVDAITRGENPPQDPDVVRTPRRGATVSARLAVILPGRPAGPWARQDSGRAALCPETEAWAAALLGPPGSWSATFDIDGGGGAVTLAELGLAALDAIGEATEPPERSPLARRVAAHAAQALGASAGQVTVGGDDLADLTTLCGHVRSVLASAQPLLPGAFVDDVQQGWEMADLELIANRLVPWTAAARAEAASLQTAAEALRGGGTDRTAADTAARRLADLGVMAANGFDSIADPAGAGAALAARVQAAATDPGPVPTDPAGRSHWYATTLAAARQLLGDWWALPPPWPSAAADDALRGQRRPTGASEDSIRDWLAARRTVRPAVAAFDDLLTCGEVLGASGPAALAVAQEPFTADVPWAGDHPVNGPAATTIVFADSQRDPGAVRSGLLIDDWVEVVPAAPDGPADADGSRRLNEIAGAAFNVERPDAQAPQAVLLAVAPDPDRPWVEEDLHAIVEETFALSRIRTLDAIDLPELRWTIPW